MLRVNSDGLMKENKSGETPLDYFFKDWYFTILKTVNNSLPIFDPFLLLKEQQSGVNTNNTLSMDYVVGNVTIQWIYDISRTLFSVHETITHASTEEHPSFMLKNSFKTLLVLGYFVNF